MRLCLKACYMILLLGADALQALVSIEFSIYDSTTLELILY